MTTPTHNEGTPGADSGPAPLRFLAGYGIYIALPVIFFWFGAMKFTAIEADAIEGLMANSPFMSILLDMFGKQGASYVIGVIELSVGALLLARFVSPKIAILGALGSIATYLITLTFFFSTPGVFLPDVGPLAISVTPGQFLLKDLVLLAASIWALNESLAASRR